MGFFNVRGKLVWVIKGIIENRIKLTKGIKIKNQYKK